MLVLTGSVLKSEIFTLDHLVGRALASDWSVNSLKMSMRKLYIVVLWTENSD